MSLADVSATSLLAGFPEPMLVIQADGTLVFIGLGELLAEARHDFRVMVAFSGRIEELPDELQGHGLFQ